MPRHIVNNPPPEIPLKSIVKNPWGAEDALYSHDGGSHSDGQKLMIPSESGGNTYTLIFDDEIRRIFDLSADQEVSLRALKDPPAGQRPGYPIFILCQLAILGSPHRQLTLQGIYQALQDRFEWFRNNPDDKSWKVRAFSCI